MCEPCVLRFKLTLMYTARVPGHHKGLLLTRRNLVKEPVSISWALFQIQHIQFQVCLIDQLSIPCAWHWIQIS
jgi:hypothetical protein